MELYSTGCLSMIKILGVLATRMPDNNLSLFRVTKAHAAWTIVLADSRKHAEEVASKLDDDAYEAKPVYSAVRIIRRSDLSDDWLSGIPWSDPDRNDNDSEHTCSAFFPEPPPPIDEVEQHALYQSMNGSVILRPPRGDDERGLYDRLAVHRTSDNVYFTTLKPLPRELTKFFVCYAIRPDNAFTNELNA